MEKQKEYMLLFRMAFQFLILESQETCLQFFFPYDNSD